MEELPGFFKQVVLLVLIIFGVLIAYPFFAIDYFDVLSVHKVVIQYFIIPILIVDVVAAAWLNKKYLRRYNPITHSKIRKLAQDIANFIFVFIFFAAILYGLAFSFVITTNAYLGKQQTIHIEAAVLNYSTTISRGYQRKYIEFKNPLDSSLVRMNVFKEYKHRELFIKDMKVGKWGLLYSID